MKVYAPNESYTGISASVAFCNGVGETDDPHLLEWFKSHGYGIEESPKEEVPKEEAEQEKEKKAASKKAGE